MTHRLYALDNGVLIAGRHADWVRRVYTKLYGRPSRRLELVKLNQPMLVNGPAPINPIIPQLQSV